MKKILLLLSCFLTAFASFAQDHPIPQRSLLIEADTFPVVFTQVAMVDTVALLADIQHLQDFGTRNCIKPGGVQAQNWISDRMQSLGLSVELQNFPMGGYDASDNVIGTLTGWVNPDEYVVIGGHYDSYAWGDQEPGADDNATGTAGVLEAARILGQYKFERSIVFCAFSGEEYGLYGSEAYAARAQQQGMNILGYFNIDMSGYNAPGETIHTDMIAPASATELSDFYKAVSAIYLPGFPVLDATVIPGGSDHMSFNNHGYMGIFPCEEDQSYSPFIHTADDLVGASVNSLLKVQKFTQASLASVATLAIPYDPVGQSELRDASPVARIYPLPAGDRVTIGLDRTGPARVEIFDLAGQKIMTSVMDGRITLDISGLKPGSYPVRITGRDFSLGRMMMVK
ncbi:MAG TPA: M20/M25/M40 family metallo-hydrolase [Bacteroidales bacterium]|nr:M20/M25/M40 family metallo-hydrolase [Bacteroidales bacterium]